MARIRFDFGTLAREATLLDTATAHAVSAALPLSSSVLTWGSAVDSYYLCSVPCPACPG